MITHQRLELLNQLVEAGHLTGESRPIGPARTLSLILKNVGQRNS
jgi:hypothetical protein